MVARPQFSPMPTSAKGAARPLAAKGAWSRGPPGQTPAAPRWGTDWACSACGLDNWATRWTCRGSDCCGVRALPAKGGTPQARPLEGRAPATAEDRARRAAALAAAAATAEEEGDEELAAALRASGEALLPRPDKRTLEAKLAGARGWKDRAEKRLERARAALEEATEALSLADAEHDEASDACETLQTELLEQRNVTAGWGHAPAPRAASPPAPTGPAPSLPPPAAPADLLNAVHRLLLEKAVCDPGATAEAKSAAEGAAAAQAYLEQIATALQIPATTAAPTQLDTGTQATPAAPGETAGAGHGPVRKSAAPRPAPFG